jgi:CobQ-like glutamine amidotransferase family enzyme
MKLTIGHLYPDLLNLYGDRGNIQCLRKRLEWRGIEAEVIPFISGDTIDFSKLDSAEALTGNRNWSAPISRKSGKISELM